MNQRQSIHIACELPEHEQQRCADTYKSGLFSHVEDVRDRSGGYSLRFAWNPERVRELGEFLAVESSCCSFLDHSVEIPRGKGVIWLHLTGPDDARPVLMKELEPLLPRHISLPTGGTVTRASRGRLAAFGVSGVGLAAVLCCAAPAVGVAAVSTAGAWFIDSALALSLAFGLVALAWTYFRRRAERQVDCCS